MPAMSWPAIARPTPTRIVTSAATAIGRQVVGAAATS